MPPLSRYTTMAPHPPIVHTTADPSADLPAQDPLPALIARHPPRQDSLLPLLHDIQAHLGWVPPQALPAIARALGLGVAEVQGVVSFYEHFRTAPPGRRVLQLCRAEACQALGGRALEAHVRARLGIDFHDTTDDGEVTLEPVYCLGNCARPPSVCLGERVLGAMSPSRLDTLLGLTATKGEAQS